MYPDEMRPEQDMELNGVYWGTDPISAMWEAGMILPLFGWIEYDIQRPSRGRTGFRMRIKSDGCIRLEYGEPCSGKTWEEFVAGINEGVTPWQEEMGMAATQEVSHQTSRPR